MLVVLCVSNDSRNHTKAFDIEDGSDTLCFGFDDSLDSATDFHLRGIIHAQQVVKNQCGGTFQLDEPQSNGTAQPCTIVIDVRYGVANQSARSVDFYLFCKLGKTALAEGAGG